MSEPVGGLMDKVTQTLGLGSREFAERAGSYMVHREWCATRDTASSDCNCGLVVVLEMLYGPPPVAAVSEAAPIFLAADALLREIEDRPMSKPIHETDILWYACLLREAIIAVRGGSPRAPERPKEIP